MLRKVFACSLILSIWLYASSSIAHKNYDCSDLLITPDVIALARDGSGRLRPIIKAPGDEIESHILHQINNWDYRRESVVVPLTLTFDRTKATLAPDAAWLPPSVRDILINGGRFETTTDASAASSFALWMIAPPEGSNRRGRTGVLLDHGRPIVVSEPRSNDQFLIELKGAGLPTGGYAESKHYRALQGGLWEFHGELEYDRLRLIFGQASAVGVKGLAHQRFDGEYGAQDILWRLTPGNLRASLRGTSDLKRTAAQTDALMTAVASQIAEIFASDHFLASHPENFVTNQNFDAAWTTDLLDVLPFDGLPRQVEDVAYDEPTAIAHSLRMVMLFSDFERTRHWPIVWDTVARELTERNIIPRAKLDDLRTLAEPEEVAVRLMQAGFAKRIFDRRRLNGYNSVAAPEIDEALKQACAKPDAREHGARMAEFWSHFPTTDANPVLIRLKENLITEAKRAASGEVSFDEWLSLPITSFMLALESGLNLSDTYLPVAEKDSLVQIMTLNAFPSWTYLRRHLEREYRLLHFALKSNPEDSELLRNISALKTVTDWYAEVTIDELLRFMCDDPVGFRRKFELPYHRR